MAMAVSSIVRGIPIPNNCEVKTLTISSGSIVAGQFVEITDFTAAPATNRSTKMGLAASGGTTGDVISVYVPMTMYTLTVHFSNYNDPDNPEENYPTSYSYIIETPADGMLNEVTATGYETSILVPEGAIVYLTADLMGMGGCNINTNCAVATYIDDTSIFSHEYSDCFTISEFSGDAYAKLIVDV